MLGAQEEGSVNDVAIGVAMSPGTGTSGVGRTKGDVRRGC